jgi:hypothetical protein
VKKFFYNLFSDSNNINEKSIVGFISFAMMVLTLIIDIITGIIGIDMPIEQFIFDGFLILSLGVFGIASVDKFVNKNKSNGNDEELG